MVLKEKDIAGLKKLIHDALLAEWKAQGHYMTGKVVEEIDYVITQDLNAFSLTGFMYPYGVYQDQGVSAGNIPFNPGSGAGKSKYIDGLVRFVQQRMAISDLKEAKSVAFAIAHTHKKEGMPSRGSYQFSSTGKRKEWVSEGLNKNIDKIGNYIRLFYKDFMTRNLRAVLSQDVK